MSDDIRSLIQEARRELRRASGLPLTPEEKADEHRAAEMDAMNKFVFNTFHIRLMAPLRSIVIWTDKGAAAEFTVERRTFQLRKVGDRYGLFALNEHGESELSLIEGADPHFANRVLVAIGDLPSSPGGA